tara:strand:- start:1276 stop:2304 length:1029 start_codon:yes stop_codon:yes gene_type:complete
MTATEKLNIAVIGAGIAGLACATRLQQAGHKVSVFEKSRGLGGRMSTRRTDQWQCDHGAQYFTARAPEFVAQVRAWIKEDVAAEWSPTLSSFGDRPDSLARVPQQPSVPRFVGIPKMSAPANALGRLLNIQKHVRVAGLERRDTQWLLSAETADAVPSQHTFDAVLLAIPGPQAAELLAGADESLAQACRQYTMSACWAVMLTPQQPLAIEFDGAFVNDQILSWIAKDTSKPARSGAETWLMHATPQWSQEHIEADPGDVAQALRSAFLSLTGTPEAQLTQADINVHRWRFAQADTASERAVPGYLWNPTLRLGVCGDWLNGGRVEGAWLSGHRLASQLANS